MEENKTEERRNLDFIEQIVEKDLAEGKNGGRLQTRFPPEPNGYLHIGHAKAICEDFGVAEKFGGVCNLRLDDTNPQKENTDYVEGIKRDIQWLGFKWGNIYYASDYFQKLWDFAVRLIKEGKAYVTQQIAHKNGRTRSENRKIQDVFVRCAAPRRYRNCRGQHRRKACARREGRILSRLHRRTVRHGRRKHVARNAC